MRTSLLLLCALCMAAKTPLDGPCAAASSSAQLTRAGEPGPALHVEARVFRPDGQTPAPGVIVYAYQTGADGLYGPQGTRDVRIHGWMKTDASGRFRFDTIRPAPYPNATIAAHIHFQIWGDGVEPQTAGELLFEDDPLVSQKERESSARQGTFGFIKKVEKGQVSIQLRLKEKGDRFGENTLHGLRPCGFSGS